MGLGFVLDFREELVIPSGSLYYWIGNFLYQKEFIILLEGGLAGKGTKKFRLRPGLGALFSWDLIWDPQRKKGWAKQIYFPNYFFWDPFQKKGS